jgi:hypothetical protein
MNFAMLGTTPIFVITAVVIVVAGAIVVYLLQKRRTKRLRGQFGQGEYERAVTEGHGRRHAEAKLEKREERVLSFHLRPLTSSDRARFFSSWTKVQAHFVDGPAIAVNEADQLLRDVMSTLGYPVSDFDQCAADISVDHPQVIEDYRAAHDVALRQVNGQASTEDLRRAMIHYRALFQDMAGQPQEFNLKVAS